jgi:hypothetical protein
MSLAGPHDWLPICPRQPRARRPVPTLSHFRAYASGDLVASGAAAVGHRHRTGTGSPGHRLRRRYHDQGHVNGSGHCRGFRPVW